MSSLFFDQSINRSPFISTTNRSSVIRLITIATYRRTSPAVSAHVRWRCSPSSSSSASPLRPKCSDAEALQQKLEKLVHRRVNWIVVLRVQRSKAAAGTTIVVRSVNRHRLASMFLRRLFAASVPTLRSAFEICVCLWVADLSLHNVGYSHRDLRADVLPQQDHTTR